MTPESPGQRFLRDVEPSSWKTDMPELSDASSIPSAIPPVRGDRRAVLDVGTNSVKLLVGDVCDGVVYPLYETSEQTRLGEGFYESHLLQPAAIARTTAAVSRLLNQALVWQPQRVRIVATSAARDARNGHLLVEGAADGLDG